ncbi:hypothetical protein HN695_07600 [Candidatus Woesearchaeota archaeon]|nr:hypothetical protein [Candidatus Woesearchaeota archaeon]MBT5272637.1 hypothetical protein [Candidatus Woesearchaeota archaeon]MBT6041726.1 hypothetical protein [Candidatus Woesearchaeota archaeon]MBT6337189.1 hypothetical protein [Candidatus Woesearchaeota archaeon]MBT7928173.1 hypothetical protein [Candidatus Woesearchaeota archaeon]
MSDPAIDIGLQTNNITILYGSLPIIAVAIHNKERNTVETAEKLHQEIGTYSFIYHGPRKTCWRGTQNAMYEVMDNMITSYGSVGVISLHRRSDKIKVAEPKDKNFFELGTLNDHSLDTLIKETFRKLLSNQGLVFDDNIRFDGGQEIRGIHRRYNNPDYVKGDKSSYDASKNKVQIAQLELNGSKPYIIEHYSIAKTLTESILLNLT